VTGERDRPERLLDDPRLRRAEGSPESWAVDLLSAADPYAVPAGRKQRVRLLLQPASLARAPGWLRPAIVVGAVIACGAASAALGPFRGWPTRTYQRIVGAPAAPAAVSAPPRAHRVAVARPEPSATSIPEAAAPPAVLAVVEPPRAAAAPSPRRRSAPTVSDEDTASVMEAMRALRLENNPVRARGLLAHYLDRHPNGTLADEALAMTIQAAVAHHEADAPVLAARYLKLHPQGPFRALAQQTLSAARGP
jgi:hypothetical protein